MDPEEWKRIFAEAGATTPIQSDSPTIYWGPPRKITYAGGGAPGRGEVAIQSPSSPFQASPAGRQSGRKRDTVIASPSSPVQPGTRSTPEQTKTLDEAILEFYRWTPEERLEWGQHLVSLGLLDEEDARDFKALEQAWKEIVNDAANLNLAGHKMDPWQVATMIAGDESDIAERRRGQVDEEPFSGVKTTRSVDLTDPKSAQALVNDVLSRALGRAAGPEEMSEFLSTLQAAERSNPTVTSTTYQAGEAVSRETSGGLGGAGAQQVLLERAQAKPDYGAYQSATTYFSALASAIDSPV